MLTVHVLTFGIGEETGWPGFALPRLQSCATATHSTHILAVFWGVWHVPSFFENDSMMSMGSVQIFGWAAGLWMGAVFLTWLYNSSTGSLLVVELWHGLFNLFAASDAPDIVAAVPTMGVIAIAIFAINHAGPRDLRGLSPRSGCRQMHSVPGSPLPDSPVPGGEDAK